MSDLVVNRYGTNAAIGFFVPSPERMEANGFVDVGDAYLLRRRVSVYGGGVWLEVSVPKGQGGDLRIDVRDDWDGSPYDYQEAIAKDPADAYALHVRGNVEEVLARLKAAGIISNHEFGEYV